MIHLDSNLLIALADAADPHRETALRLMRPFPQAAVSSMAWWEFECGPVSPEANVEPKKSPKDSAFSTQ